MIELYYKSLSKNFLYNAIEKLYHQRDLCKLKDVCEYYLSLFSEINDTQVRMVKFFYAFSINNFSTDVQHIYEELYNDKNTEDYIKTWVEYNLIQCYKNTYIQSPQQQQVVFPKIVHLIYFKERNFEKYHYICIKSIVDNCKDYTINIYNDIEPINNEWWDKMKLLHRLNIINTPRIKYFDDFPINYVQYEADILRLKVLYKFGGIYFDTDVLLVKNIDLIIDKYMNDNYHKFLISKEHQAGGLINSFLASTRENPFCMEWLNSFKSGLRMDNWAYHVRETSRQLLEKNAHFILKYGINILSHEFFFPYKWEEKFAYDGSIDVISKLQNTECKTIGFHLFDTINHNLLLNNTYINDV